MPNTTPIFVLSGNYTPSSATAANTASDGSGTLITIVTASASGTRVDAVRFRNSQITTVTSSTNVHRIFLSNTSGASFKLVGEVITAAATRSASVVGATSIYTFDYPIIMKPGQILSWCQHVYAGAQDRFDACAFAGDY